MVTESSDLNKTFEKEQLNKEVAVIKEMIKSLYKEREQIDRKNKELLDRNAKLSKEGDALAKKREVSG